MNNINITLYTFLYIKYLIFYEHLVVCCNVKNLCALHHHSCAFLACRKSSLQLFQHLSSATSSPACRSQLVARQQQLQLLQHFSVYTHATSRIIILIVWARPLYGYDHNHLLLWECFQRIKQSLRHVGVPSGRTHQAVDSSLFDNIWKRKN